MVQVVQEYDEVAADFKTVVMDSPQHTSQHAPLDTPDGTKYADSQYPWPTPQNVATPRGVVGMLKVMPGKKTNH
eukprot:3230512-Ditylum_brightwellii.AAC.1